MAVVQPGEAQSESPRVESIEELFQALESPLLAYALRLLDDMALAEDIVQDAFLKLQTRLGEVREPRRWLYRTVHNQALNQRRSLRKIVPLTPTPEESGRPAQDPPDPLPLPDEQLARLESIGLVRLSLQSLDPRSRELVQLKFGEDLSYKDISSRTGLTIGHVGYLLHHALKAIAAELAKAGVLP
jgi:RNA polymerase sigma factor (sigma-70 family)